MSRRQKVLVEAVRLRDGTSVPVSCEGRPCSVCNLVRKKGLCG